MSNKPRIWANCKAGCAWETIHKSDFDKVATLIKQTPDENGRVYLEFGKKYKVFADPKEVTHTSGYGGGTETVFDCYVERGFYSGGTLYRSYHTNQNATSYYEDGNYLTIDDQYSNYFTMRVLDMREGVQVGTNAVTVDVIYELEQTDENGNLIFGRRKDQILNVADPKDISGQYAFVEGAKAVYLCNGDVELKGAQGDKGEDGEVTFNYANKKYSNSLVGSASGEKTVRIDDISPNEHTLDVRVKSKNLLDVANATVWTLAPGTWDDFLLAERYGTGIKMTALTDVSNQYNRAGYALGRTKDFLGKTLTLSVGNSVFSSEAAFKSSIGWALCKHDNYYLSGQSNLFGGGTTYESSLTFTVPDDADYETYPYIRLLFYINAGGTCSVGDYAIYEDIMVEESASASEYVPYVAPESVEVKRYGKNLITFPYLDGNNKTFNGITYTVNADGSVTANGTATATSYFKLCEAEFGKYLAPLVTNGKYISRDCYYNSTQKTAYIEVANGEAVTNKVFYPQIELGTKVTEWEPYVEPTEYTPNEDGTVEGVKSIYPTTTLVSDTANVILGAGYNKDANKVVASLEERLAALEAAVISK